MSDSESILTKAVRLAPMTAVGAAMYGLEHAPAFTVNVLNGLAIVALGNYVDRTEARQYADNMHELMRQVGPWRDGPKIAQASRTVVEWLPTNRLSVALLDPYYFDPTMTYSDPEYGEGNQHLFVYGYRLRPCGVFALNYDFTEDDPRPLVQSLICVAFLRGMDLEGRELLFSAIWQEGLPLGAECAFEIPRWGALRPADTPESLANLKKLFTTLTQDATQTGVSDAEAIAKSKMCLFGFDKLPTPVERGYPNLAGTIWHGCEPFPKLENFEYELIGADYRQRGQSVPHWFRPARGIG